MSADWGVTESGTHWEAVYGAKAPDEVSWFEREPSISLLLVERLVGSPSTGVIDVGGGTSLLVDRLVARGFDDVTVLDISEHALAVVRARLGALATRVTFLHEEIARWEPERQYGIWHDRAVFHFLTEPAARDRYVEVAARAVSPGGALVLAAFAPGGPTSCSGLPVSRYSADELAELFASSFSPIDDRRELHTTPRGEMQPFTWVALRRN
jgi:SAM-dependent methyltransferase